jgi:hypothetical protein
MSIACIAMLVVTAGAMAGTNAVDGSFRADFELYDNGDEIASTTNDALSKWVAADGGYMIATNSPLNNLPESQLAMPDSAHTRAAKLDTEGSAITNHLAGPAGTNVWLDMNIQMVPSDSQPTSITNDSDVQTALYVGTNGQLNIYHATLTPPSTYGDNEFTELSHTAMETESWHRLTVAMHYDGAFGAHFCQVTLDGTAIEDAKAWVNPDDPNDGTSGGSWFVCANSASIDNKISMALFSGTGYLDDFVVTNGAPDQTATTYYTNGVPSYWLTSFNLELNNSSSGALYNADGDVHPAWAEWLLGTHPGESNSFQLMISSTGGTNTLIWVADDEVDENAPDLMLKKSTNLLDGYTSTITVDRATEFTGGTNNWVDDTGTGDAMYRLGVLGVE